MVERMDETIVAWIYILLRDGKKVLCELRVGENWPLPAVNRWYVHPNFVLLRDQQVTPCAHCNNATNKKTDSSSYANIPWQFFGGEDLCTQKPGIQRWTFNTCGRCFMTDFEKLDSLGSFSPRGTIWGWGRYDGWAEGAERRAMVSGVEQPQCVGNTS